MLCWLVCHKICKILTRSLHLASQKLLAIQQAYTYASYIRNISLCQYLTNVGEDEGGKLVCGIWGHLYLSKEIFFSEFPEVWEIVLNSYLFFSC